MKIKNLLCLLLVWWSAAVVLVLVMLVVGCQSAKVVAADQAEVRIRYVAPQGEDVGDCTDLTAPCASVQYAVDRANEGDEVRIAAGTYTQVSGRPAPPGYAGPSVITQCVYLTKTLTLRGGYTSQASVDEGQEEWNVSDPAANPTILDAQEQGRVLFIGGEISPTIEGLRTTGGNASDLGGFGGDNAGGGST